MFKSIHPEGIEPPSQEPESYVISITLRVETKEFQALAQSLLPINEPADYNEAIMDFGATQCTPNSPHCSSLSTLRDMRCLRDNAFNELPVKSQKSETTRTSFHLSL